MSRAEDRIIGSIDRRRERAVTREDRTSRRAALQARADAVVACEIGQLPANDHADFSEAMAASLRLHLIKHHGEPCAATILSREAGIAGRDILPRKIAAAAAEQAFSKLTKAAND